MRGKLTYDRDDEHFSADAYSINGYSGIAWYVLGWETEPGDTEWWDDEAGETVYDDDPETKRTGRIVAVMIGDDRHFTFDEDEATPIARKDYCGECGQIGCGHDGLDRSEEE